MKINLHIDQIVIHGTTLTRREREQLATTLEQELALQVRARSTGETAARTEGDRPSGDPAGASSLGVRIASDVLAALPVDALTGRPPASVTSTARFRARQAGQGARR